MNMWLLQKDGQSIALLGVQNWSAKARFPKYGDMEKAYAGAEAYPFKILMSHDPSHWDAEVRTKYPDVDLMLSGHTHGMQFGVELPGFKWSPVQYVYEQWAGLYEKDAQKLVCQPGLWFYRVSRQGRHTAGDNTIGTELIIYRIGLLNLYPRSGSHIPHDEPGAKIF